MEREFKTVGLMIDLYCRGHHGSKAALCPDCQELLDYVKQRLEKCPLKAEKPRCSKCPVHCYKPDMRERIKAVMKYSGPRMIYRHPVLTAKHYLTKRYNIDQTTVNKT
jgi:predicted amidophosphoribosyltransferase